MGQHVLEEPLHRNIGSNTCAFHKPQLILVITYTSMARPTSYFDRNQTIWTHEQMMQRLAQRCGPTPLQAAQSPKEKSILKWGRAVVGSTEVKTECGTYQCCKDIKEGKVAYSLWKRNPTPNVSPYVRIINGLDNFLQAQTLAQQDADK
jgi:hypothetical protein